MGQSAQGGSGDDNERERKSAEPPEGHRDVWPIKRFQPSGGRRIGNRVAGMFARWGLIPHTYLLTTKGRKTGRLHSTPVTLVEKDKQKWLVAPYGPVAWVLNTRAAGRVTVSRKGKSTEYLVAELSAPDAGPVLKDYLRIAGATKSYFEATKDSPVQDFAAEAHRHPVFTLTPAE